jgi:hypothetical protein
MRAHYTQNIKMLDLAERTSDGESNVINVEEYSEGLIFINVDTVSGTNPLLEIYVNVLTEAGSLINYTKYEIEDITSQGTFLQELEKFGKYIKLVYKLSGTDPNFKFEAIFQGKN